jgi:hypothetical protein
MYIIWIIMNTSKIGLVLWWKLRHSYEVHTTIYLLPKQKLCIIERLESMCADWCRIVLYCIVLYCIVEYCHTVWASDRHFDWQSLTLSWILLDLLQVIINEMFTHLSLNRNNNIMQTFEQYVFYVLP